MKNSLSAWFRRPAVVKPVCAWKPKLGTYDHISAPVMESKTWTMPSLPATNSTFLRELAPLPSVPDLYSAYPSSAKFDRGSRTYSGSAFTRSPRTATLFGTTLFFHCPVAGSLRGPRLRRYWPSRLRSPRSQSTTQLPWIAVLPTIMPLSPACCFATLRFAHWNGIPPRGGGCGIGGASGFGSGS